MIFSWPNVLFGKTAHTAEKGAQFGSLGKLDQCQSEDIFKIPDRGPKLFFCVSFCQEQQSVENTSSLCRSFDSCDRLLSLGCISNLSWDWSFEIGLATKHHLSCQGAHGQKSFQHGRIFDPDSESRRVTFCQLRWIFEIEFHFDQRFAEFWDCWVECKWMSTFLFISLESSLCLVEFSNEDWIVLVWLDTRFYN